jgi:hypothetical protein
MRTSELIEENASQALSLLVQYAQSSRTFTPLLLKILSCLIASHLGCEKWHWRTLSSLPC